MSSRQMDGQDLWTTLVDSRGRSYRYNTATCESLWLEDTSASTNSSTGDTTISGEHVMSQKKDEQILNQASIVISGLRDPVSKREYFYDPSTGRSSWEAPSQSEQNSASQWVRVADTSGREFEYDLISKQSRWVAPSSSVTRSINPSLSSSTRHFQIAESRKRKSRMYRLKDPVTGNMFVYDRDTCESIFESEFPEGHGIKLTEVIGQDGSDVEGQETASDDESEGAREDTDTESEGEAKEEEETFNHGSLMEGLLAVRTIYEVEKLFEVWPSIETFEEAFRHPRRHWDLLMIIHQIVIMEESEFRRWKYHVSQVSIRSARIHWLKSLQNTVTEWKTRPNTFLREHAEFLEGLCGFLRTQESKEPCPFRVSGLAGKGDPRPSYSQLSTETRTRIFLALCSWGLEKGAHFVVSSLKPETAMVSRAVAVPMEPREAVLYWFKSIAPYRLYCDAKRGLMLLCTDAETMGKVISRILALPDLGLSVAVALKQIHREMIPLVAVSFPPEVNTMSRRGSPITVSSSSSHAVGGTAQDFPAPPVVSSNGANGGPPTNGTMTSTISNNNTHRNGEVPTLESSFLAQEHQQQPSAPTMQVPVPIQRPMPQTMGQLVAHQQHLVDAQHQYQMRVWQEQRQQQLAFEHQQQQMMTMAVLQGGTSLYPHQQQLQPMVVYAPHHVRAPRAIASAPQPYQQKQTSSSVPPLEAVVLPHIQAFSHPAPGLPISGSSANASPSLVVAKRSVPSSISSSPRESQSSRSSSGSSPNFAAGAKNASTAAEQQQQEQSDPFPAVDHSIITPAQPSEPFSSSSSASMDERLPLQGQEQQGEKSISSVTVIQQQEEESSFSPGASPSVSTSTARIRDSNVSPLEHSLPGLPHLNHVHSHNDGEEVMSLHAFGDSPRLDMPEAAFPVVSTHIHAAELLSQAIQPSRHDEGTTIEAEAMDSSHGRDKSLMVQGGDSVREMAALIESVVAGRSSSKEQSGFVVIDEDHKASSPISEEKETSAAPMWLSSSSPPHQQTTAVASPEFKDYQETQSSASPLKPISEVKPKVGEPLTSAANGADHGETSPANSATGSKDQSLKTTTAEIPFNLSPSSQVVSLTGTKVSPLAPSPAETCAAAAVNAPPYPALVAFTRELVQTSERASENSEGAKEPTRDEEVTKTVDVHQDRMDEETPTKRRRLVRDDDDEDDINTARMADLAVMPLTQKPDDDSEDEMGKDDNTKGERVEKKDASVSVFPATQMPSSNDTGESSGASSFTPSGTVVAGMCTEQTEEVKTTEQPKEKETSSSDKDKRPQQQMPLFYYF